jgi:ketosteroid isomerase-like protein
LGRGAAFLHLERPRGGTNAGRRRNMKRLGGLTIPILTAGVLVLGACALPAWGQGGNPPASTKASGKTSGRGYTAVEQTPGNVEQEIKSLQEESRKAALKGDASFLEKYLADDYVAIDGNGGIVTKAQAIQALKSGTIKYESIDVRDTKIRTYGNTAIVDSLASLKLTSDGKPISGDFRATFVWVKQKGNWKRVAFQSTPVRP